jgi:hypothetical protein
MHATTNLSFRVRDGARVVWHVASSLYRLSEVVVWAARRDSRDKAMLSCQGGERFGPASAVCS